MKFAAVIPPPRVWSVYFVSTYCSIPLYLLIVSSLQVRFEKVPTATDAENDDDIDIVMFNLANVTLRSPIFSHRPRYSIPGADEFIVGYPLDVEFPDLSLYESRISVQEIVQAPQQAISWQQRIADNIIGAAQQFQEQVRGLGNAIYGNSDALRMPPPPRPIANPRRRVTARSVLHGSGHNKNYVKVRFEDQLEEYSEEAKDKLEAAPDEFQPNGRNAVYMVSSHRWSGSAFVFVLTRSQMTLRVDKKTSDRLEADMTALEHSVEAYAKVNGVQSQWHRPAGESLFFVVFPAGEALLDWGPYESRMTSIRITYGHKPLVEKTGRASRVEKRKAMGSWDAATPEQRYMRNQTKDPGYVERLENRSKAVADGQDTGEGTLIDLN